MGLRDELLKAATSAAARFASRTADSVPAPPEQRKGVAMRDFGRTGVRRFGREIGQEYDPKLRGQRAARLYTQMVDESAGLGGAMLLIQSILAGLEVTFEPKKDAPPEAEPFARFFTEAWSDLATGQRQLMLEWSSLVRYGFSLSEVLFKLRLGPGDDPRLSSDFADGLFGWRDFEPRAADSVYEWIFDADERPVAFVQRVEGTASSAMCMVPLAKCLHFTMPSVARSPEGRSLLRSARRANHFRRQLETVEAIGADRNLDGIPDIQVPPHVLTDPEYAQEKAAWIKMARRLRMDEQEGIVRPAEKYGGEETGYAFGLVSSGADPSKADPIIQRHRTDELMAVLSEFLALGTVSNGSGSRAVAAEQGTMLNRALSAVSGLMIDTFNMKAVRQLGRLNGFPLELLPEARISDVEQADIERLTASLGPMLTQGAVVPDDKLEEHLRDLLKLPPVDKTVRAPLATPAESRARRASDQLQLPGIDDASGEPAEQTSDDQEARED